MCKINAKITIGKYDEVIVKYNYKNQSQKNPPGSQINQLQLPNETNIHSVKLL